MRDGDPLDAVERCPRLLECITHDRCDELEVATGGDLGDDASVTLVQPSLRRHHRGEDAPVVHDRSGCLVARRLDPEDHETFSDGVTSRHMIMASSRLSV